MVIIAGGKGLLGVVFVFVFELEVSFWRVWVRDDLFIVLHKTGCIITRKERNKRRKEERKKGIKE